MIQMIARPTIKIYCVSLQHFPLRLPAACSSAHLSFGKTLLVHNACISILISYEQAEHFTRNWMQSHLQMQCGHLKHDILIKHFKF